MSYQSKGLKPQDGKVDIAKKDQLKTIAWTGIKTKKVEGGLKITSVEKNSPAWKAGFSLDDIIVAIDDLRMIDKDLGRRLKNFEVGQMIEITYFRRDELNSKSLKLAGIAKNKLTILPIDKASQQQKSFFKVWTGLDFPKDKPKT
jgi:predicted metalloprotease with PDZ domain